MRAYCRKAKISQSQVRGYRCIAHLQLQQLLRGIWRIEGELRIAVTDQTDGEVCGRRAEGPDALIIFRFINSMGPFDDTRLSRG